MQQLEAIDRLSRDLRSAAKTLTPDEVRYLVDYYYQLQRDRIRAGNQVRAMRESAEPHEVIAWLGANTGVLERNIASALGSFSQASPVGRWAESQYGIGPIISSGLLAHIDIEKAPTVGHIWRFAGLDPTSQWNKKEKRPWNARLKVLCWKIGESFVKVSGKPDALYAQLYVQRKVQEVERNDAGRFAEQSAHILSTRKIGKDTDAYASYSVGKLPPAHIHARAKRVAVKVYLAHWHTVAYFDKFQTMPPKPYVLAHLGHAHEIQVPDWPF